MMRVPLSITEAPCLLFCNRMVQLVTGNEKRAPITRRYPRDSPASLRKSRLTSLSGVSRSHV